MTSTMSAAITAHRAAWEVFQGADEASVPHAEDRETEALMFLLSTPAASRTDLLELASHIAWYCNEEGDQAGSQAWALHSILSLAMPAITQAAALLASVDFDNNGALVAGHLQGGNGGLLSRDTTKAADELRRALAEVAP